MDVDDGGEIVGHFPHGPEALVAQRHAVDVAEHHCAAEPELAAGALELFRRRSRIAERKRGHGGEATPVTYDRRESVINKTCELHRNRRLLDVRSRRGQAEYLLVDAA